MKHLFPILLSPLGCTSFGHQTADDSFRCDCSALLRIRTQKRSPTWGLCSFVCACAYHMQFHACFSSSYPPPPPQWWKQLEAWAEEADGVKIRKRYHSQCNWEWKHDALESSDLHITFFMSPPSYSLGTFFFFNMIKKWFVFLFLQVGAVVCLFYLKVTIVRLYCTDSFQSGPEEEWRNNLANHAFSAGWRCDSLGDWLKD